MEHMALLREALCHIWGSSHLQQKMMNFTLMSNESLIRIQLKPILRILWKVE